MASNTEKKIEQRKEEAYKRRKHNVKRSQRKVRPSTLKKIIACVVIVLILVAGGCAVFLNSGLARRVISAATIGNRKVSAAEYSYYYVSGFNNYYQTMSSYFGGSYIGVDMTKSLKDQAYDEDRSYADYFSDEALESLQFVSALSQEAKNAGFTLSEEEQATYDQQVETFENGAKTAGVSEDKYAEQMYGKGYTASMFKNILMDELLAYDYRESVEDGFTYTEEDLDAYYQENKETYDKVDYRYEAFRTQEADEEAGTEEVTLEQAKAEAEAFMADISSETDFAEKSTQKEYEATGTGTDYSLVQASSKQTASTVDANLAEWLFDAARAAGDLELVEDADGDGYYVVYMVKPAYREDYKTRDVRHILIRKTDEMSDAEALEQAQQLLDEWKAGDATEDSFAALANEHSADTGSNTNGGLYTGIYPGEMVATFNDWVFSDHAYGDVEIVPSSYGYHIIFFVKEHELPKWQEDVDTAKRAADYEAWYEELIKNYSIKKNALGMKLRMEPLPVE